MLQPVDTLIDTASAFTVKIQIHDVSVSTGINNALVALSGMHTKLTNFDVHVFTITYCKRIWPNYTSKDGSYDILQLITEIKLCIRK